MMKKFNDFKIFENILSCCTYRSESLQWQPPTHQTACWHICQLTLNLNLSVSFLHDLSSAILHRSLFQRKSSWDLMYLWFMKYYTCDNSNPPFTKKPLGSYKLLNLRVLKFSPEWSVPLFISPWTKWMPFCRWYFQMHFHEWKFCILIKISPKFVPKHPIDNNPALVQIMAWRWIGDKPLSVPMLSWFNDAYMRH